MVRLPSVCPPWTGFCWCKAKPHVCRCFSMICRAVSRETARLLALKSPCYPENRRARTCQGDARHLPVRKEWHRPAGRVACKLGRRQRHPKRLSKRRCMVEEQRQEYRAAYPQETHRVEKRHLGKAAPGRQSGTLRAENLGQETFFRKKKPGASSPAPAAEAKRQKRKRIRVCQESLLPGEA